MHAVFSKLSAFVYAPCNQRAKSVSFSVYKNGFALRKYCHNMNEWASL